MYVGAAPSRALTQSCAPQATQLVGQRLSRVPQSTLPAQPTIPRLNVSSVLPSAQIGQAGTATLLQMTSQSAADPVIVSVVQAPPSSQEVGQLPSQVSGDSTMPLPRIPFRRSLLIAAIPLLPVLFLTGAAYALCLAIPPWPHDAQPGIYLLQEGEGGPERRL